MPGAYQSSTMLRNRRVAPPPVGLMLSVESVRTCSALATCAAGTSMASRPTTVTTDFTATVSGLPSPSMSPAATVVSTCVKLWPATAGNASIFNGPTSCSKPVTLGGG